MANKKKKKGFRLKSQCSQQHCFSTKASKHSAVRRQWSDVQMKEAIGSVLNDGLSQKQADDLQYHVPL